MPPTFENNGLEHVYSEECNGLASRPFFGNIWTSFCSSGRIPRLKLAQPGQSRSDRLDTRRIWWMATQKTVARIRYSGEKLCTTFRVVAGTKRYFGP